MVEQQRINKGEKDQISPSRDQVEALITTTVDKLASGKVLTRVSEDDPRTIKTEKLVVLIYNGRLVSIIDTLVEDRVGNALVPNEELSKLTFVEIITKHTRPVAFGVSLKIPRDTKQVSKGTLENLGGVQEADIQRLVATVTEGNEISALRFPEAKAMLLEDPSQNTSVLPGSRYDIVIPKADRLTHLIPVRKVG